MKRRVIGIALGFLLLGCASAFLSALALRVGFDVSVHTVEFIHPRQAPHGWPVDVPKKWPERRIGIRYESLATTLEHHVAQGWSTSPDLFDQRARFSFSQLDTGWPFRIAAWEKLAEVKVDNEDELSAYIRSQSVEPVGEVEINSAGTLPDQWDWFGFFGSSVAHAALWGLAWLMIESARRRVGRIGQWRLHPARSIVYGVCLIIGGVAMTYLVAWTPILSFAATSPNPNRPQIRYEVKTNPRLEWPSQTPRTWPDPTIFAVGRGYMSSTDLWHTGQEFLQVNSFGWPWRAVECDILSNSEIRGAVEFPFDTGLESNVLPVRPIWSGLICDTLFHAFALWIILPMPLEVWRLWRAWRRRRRGLCIGCGYDIADLDQCPECGREASAPLVRAVPSQL